MFINCYYFERKEFLSIKADDFYYFSIRAKHHAQLRTSKVILNTFTIYYK